ncbi:TolC family protein [Edaphocola flava]|uniref:TolC family protein n=1 Tax=Edaphocola flava TaxID=2499629 RepID=UPI00100BAC29|nr:TolC family protein [Edaphocola flava]
MKHTSFMSFAIAMFILWVCSARTYAQTSDTLRVNLNEVEQTFLEKNLLLLAQHYQVNADSALITQARLWDNPVLSTDQNVYANRRFFEHGVNPDGTPRGQFLVQVEQLIQLGGKRSKNVALAGTNATITYWQFIDLMRTLKLELRNNYYTLIQALNLSRLYAEEDGHLDQLVKGMQAQLQAGNIARKDLLRLQALQLTLHQKIADNHQQIEDLEASLRTLLQTGPQSVLIPSEQMNNKVVLPPLQDAMTTAIEYNPEYKIENYRLTGATQNLAVQKAMAVPDLTISPNFDQNSNYTPNYWGLGLSIPIPVFNRNQGNIKAAQFQIRSQQAVVDNKRIALQNNVAAAYNKLVAVQKMNADNQDVFYKDYDALYDNIVQSYKQRQLSLVEFIDYHQAYLDVMSQKSNLALQLQLAKEELNFQSGADLVK